MYSTRVRGWVDQSFKDYSKKQDVFVNRERLEYFILQLEQRSIFHVIRKKTLLLKYLFTYSLKLMQTYSWPEVVLRGQAAPREGAAGTLWNLLEAAGASPHRAPRPMPGALQSPGGRILSQGAQRSCFVNASRYLPNEGGLRWAERVTNAGSCEMLVGQGDSCFCWAVGCIFTFCNLSWSLCCHAFPLLNPCFWTLREIFTVVSKS